VHLRVPTSDGRNLSLVHAGGQIIHSEMNEKFIDFEAELPESLARRLEDFVFDPASTPKTREIGKR
jgi:hypothetical protein